MMPELEVHLGVWSGNRDSYPYPQNIAVTIGALRPEAISAAAGILVGLSPVLNDGYFEVDRLAGRLVAAWSADEPVVYLRGLAAATDAAVGVIDRVRDALLPAVEVFTRAQSVVAQAITVANSATDWKAFVSQGTPEAAHRDSICLTLRTTLRQQLSLVESTLAGLDGLFRLDPQAGIAGLPTAGGYTPQPGPTAVSRVGDRNLAQLAADLSSASWQRRRFASGVLAGLHRAGAEATAAQLLIYDPDAFGGQGRASISVGDLASADHVAVLTPGIGNSPSDMGGTADTARSLIGQAEQVAPGETTAVVLWFGYDIPLSEGIGNLAVDPADYTNDAYAATNADSARAGGEQLAADTAWIARLAAPDATLTAIGHSMGSTAISEAARFELPVDNMVLLGSPGVGYDATTAGDYASVTRENVFVMAHPFDPVTHTRTDVGAALIDGPRFTSPFGPDPADSSFGAQQIDVPSGVPFDLSDTNPRTLPLVMGGLDIHQHAMSNYLTGAAGLAVARVITGRTAQVKRKPGR